MRRSWFQRLLQSQGYILAKVAIFQFGRAFPKRCQGEDVKQRVYERLVRGRDQAEC